MTIYPRKEASFKSKYDLSESVSRLSSHVKSRKLIRRFHGGIFGTVEPEKVILQHLHPFRLYAGLMQFSGTFSKRNGYIELSGKFEVPKCSRVLMNTLLIFNMLLLCLPYILGVSEPAKEAILTLSVILIFLWICIIFITYRRGKIDDIEYISQMIEKAFE